MNKELLKARMDEFFANVKPEYLVQEFEKMGYTFVDCEIDWSPFPLPTPNTTNDKT